MTDYQRYREHIRKHSTDDDKGCWIWNRCTNGKYPLHGLRKQESRYAHRLSWRAFNEKRIEPGLVINHTCRNSLCVNPEHLEVVTQQYNVQIGIVGNFATGRCVMGHQLVIRSDGRGRCRECQRQRDILRRHRRD